MTLEYGDDQHRLLLAFGAFDAALGRWGRVRETLDETEVFGTVTECLWWAVALDENLHALRPDDYRPVRDADQDGRIIPGVWWARNRAGHLLGLVPRREPGAELGVLVLDESRLDARSELVWRNPSDLPPGRSEFGRDVYERRMQGRPVDDTLAALRRWFHGPHGPTIPWSEL